MSVILILYVKWLRLRDVVTGPNSHSRYVTEWFMGSGIELMTISTFLTSHLNSNSWAHTQI